MEILQTERTDIDLPLDACYRVCRKLATEHYENFPVGSLLAPRNLRPFLHAIYAFARTADDFADEGSLTSEERLQKLQEWQEGLDRTFQGTPETPLFRALADTIRKRGLQKQLFDDLLTAFRMDVTKSSYETFEHLRYYCKHSANPVGRLVLAVYGGHSASLDDLSDRICTALQLTNFWQDISRDIQKGRIYLPLEDFDRFGYTVADLRSGTYDQRFRNLMSFEIQRTRALFESARALPGMVGGRLGLELRLTWLGGMTILRKIEESAYAVLSGRPKLTAMDKMQMLFNLIPNAR